MTIKSVQEYQRQESRKGYFSALGATLHVLESRFPDWIGIFDMKRLYHAG